MPEMPYGTMVDYLQWGRAACDGFLYSYNHEVGVEYRGEAAGHVSGAIDQIGGFARVRRDHSWLRRGYAEEIYVPSKHAPRDDGSARDLGGEAVDPSPPSAACLRAEST